MTIKNIVPVTDARQQAIGVINSAAVNLSDLSEQKEAGLAARFPRCEYYLAMLREQSRLINKTGSTLITAQMEAEIQTDLCTWDAIPLAFDESGCLALILAASLSVLSIPSKTLAAEVANV